MTTKLTLESLLLTPQEQQKICNSCETPCCERAMPCERMRLADIANAVVYLNACMYVVHEGCNKIIDLNSDDNECDKDCSGCVYHAEDCPACALLSECRKLVGK
jgi:hypothetical protein